MQKKLTHSVMFYDANYSPQGSINSRMKWDDIYLDKGVKTKIREAKNKYSWYFVAVYVSNHSPIYLVAVDHGEDPVQHLVNSSPIFRITASEYNKLNENEQNDYALSENGQWYYMPSDFQITKIVGRPVLFDKF